MAKMIWYDEAIEFPDKPPYHIVGIEGSVENNKLSINVVMYGGGDIQVEYYSKIIDIPQDNLENDKLQEQYAGKIARIKESMGSSWVNWMQDFQRRVRLQSGEKAYYDFQARGWFYAPSGPPSGTQPAQ